MAELIALIVILGLCVYYIAANGFVLYCLWDWFIVPIFAVEPISFVMAMGLGVIASYLAVGPGMGFLINQATEGNAKASKKYFWYSMAYPWFVLLVGFIITLFL